MRPAIDTNLMIGHAVLLHIVYGKRNHECDETFSFGDIESHITVSLLCYEYIFVAGR